MSAIADPRVSPRVLDPARRRAAAVLVPGGALAAAGFVLMVLVERAGVPADDAQVGRQLVRVGAALPMLLLGALMLAHLPRHPIGWILCATPLGMTLAFAANEYAIYASAVESLPAADWAAWTSNWASAVIVLVPAVALLLFPTGRPPSRRWRPALWCGVAAYVLVALEGALGPGEALPGLAHPLLDAETARSLGDPFGLGWLLMLIASGAGLAALIVRRRTATGPELAQLRLVLRAALVVALGFLACSVGSIVTPAAFDAGAFLAIASLAVLAAAMVVAILRHRLYGLDVFVDRALVLSALTVLLGGAYVALVLGVARVLDRDAQLGVAFVATALVAVALEPLRARVQRSVSRLLHGQRDEPYAAISTLGRRLGEAMAPADVLPVIVATIAEALRLPYAAVELADGPAAVHGTPAAGIALRLPLIHAGEPVGTLVLGARAHGEPLGRADRRLLEDFARRASAAASAVALSAEVQRSRERLVTAREEERRRLRADLHDGLGPTLAGAVLTIDAARRVMTRDPAGADALLDQAAASVEGTVGEVRRLVYGLRPPALDQLGLIGALRQHARTLSPPDAALQCDVEAPDALPPLPAAVEVAAFRIAQEALTNVARHAGARRAVATIAVDGALHLEVRDDGCGLPERPSAGVGLTSMRERATELGGSFAIAPARGGGTRLRVWLPLPLPG